MVPQLRGHLLFERMSDQTMLAIADKIAEQRRRLLRCARQLWLEAAFIAAL